MITRLIDQAREFKAREHDFNVNSADIAIRPEDCALAFALDPLAGKAGGGEILTMTDWARGQLYNRLEPTIFSAAREVGDVSAWHGRKSWKDYMETCSPWLRAINLSYWLGEAKQDWLIRSFDDKARAILSRRYAVVDILECLEWAKIAMDAQPVGTPFEFRNVHMNSDSLRLSVAIRNIHVNREGSNGDDYAIGFDIGTGEIGNHRLWAMPFVQRNTCMNSIVAKSEYSFEHRHIGVRQFLAQEFVVAITNAVKGTEELLRRLSESIYEPLPNMDDIITDMVKRNGWPDGTAVAIGIGTESSSTIWGLVQGISYASTQLEDKEQRLEMDLLAGQILLGQRSADGLEF